MAKACVVDQIIISRGPPPTRLKPTAQAKAFDVTIHPPHHAPKVRMPSASEPVLRPPPSCGAACDAHGIAHPGPTELGGLRPEPQPPDCAERATTGARAKRETDCSENHTLSSPTSTHDSLFQVFVSQWCRHRLVAPSCQDLAAAASAPQHLSTKFNPWEQPAAASVRPRLHPRRRSGSAPMRHVMHKPPTRGSRSPRSGMGAALAGGTGHVHKDSCATALNTPLPLGAPRGNRRCASTLCHNGYAQLAARANSAFASEQGHPKNVSMHNGWNTTLCRTKGYESWTRVPTH